MKYSRLACALPMLALAAAAAPSIAAVAAQEAPPTAPTTEAIAQEDVEVDRVAEASFVIRYDPSSIYLTAFLLGQLCASSVNEALEPPDVAGDAASRFHLEVYERNDLQPPGVFVGSIVLVGPPIAEEASARMLARALTSLGDELSARLTEGRRKGLRSRIEQLEAWASDLRSTARELSIQRNGVVDRASLSQQIEFASAKLDSLALEESVALAEWRKAREGVKIAQLAIKQAQADVNDLGAAAERKRAMYEAGEATESEYRDAMTRARQAVAAAGRAALELEQRSAELDAMTSRRDEYATRARDARVQVDELQAVLERSRSSTETRESLDLEIETIGQRLLRVEQAISELTFELGSMIPVTITRW